MEERILEKVQKLLALARDQAGTPEGDAFLDKANELMQKHAIEEAMLNSTRTEADRRKPVAREIMLYNEGNPAITDRYRLIIGVLSEATRCKVVNVHHLGMYFVAGYAEDVEFFEMLWAVIQMSWVSAILPKWESHRSLDENVYRLATAGYKWVQIAAAAGEGDKPLSSKWKTAYNRHRKTLGLPPASHTQRHTAYRTSLADGFTTRMCSRLYDMRDANSSSAKGSGAELVLARDASAVDELMYQRYPDLRPLSPEERAERDRRVAEEDARLRAEREAYLASLTEAQRAALFAREQKEHDQRWRKMQANYARYDDPAGRDAGRRAANSVDLSGGRGNVSGGKAGELQ